MLGLGLSLSSTPVIGGAINAPSFALDFRNGDNPVTKYGFTFTRATTATYVNSAGLLATAASGELRYDYDPVTLAPRGILVEEASTNLNLLSTAINIRPGVSATGGQNDVAGGAGATKITESSSGPESHYLQLDNDLVSVVSGTVYTVSVFVKPETATSIQITLSTGRFATGYANFALSGAGTAGTVSGFTSSGIQQQANGWYRIWVTATATATSTGSTIFVAFIESDASTRLPSYVGTGRTLYVFGSQIEAKAFPTSYIPTTGAAATRNADALTLTGAAGRTNLIVGSAAPATQNVTTTATAYTLSHTGTGTITLSGTSTAGPLVGAGSLTFTPSAGTLTLTMSGTVTNAQLETGAAATAYIPTTNGPRTVENVASWFNGDAGTWVGIMRRSVSPTGNTVPRLVQTCGPGVATTGGEVYLAQLPSAGGYGSIIAGGVSQASNQPAGNYAEDGSVRKIAMAYTVDDVISCTNGVLSANDTTAAMGYLLQTVIIGNSAAGGIRPLSGALSYLAYYPRRLSNASLQALTA